MNRRLQLETILILAMDDGMNWWDVLTYLTITIELQKNQCKAEAAIEEIIRRTPCSHHFCSDVNPRLKMAFDNHDIKI